MSFHCEGFLSDAECKKAGNHDVWFGRVIEMIYCKDAVVAENSAVLLEEYSSEEAANTLRGMALCGYYLAFILAICYDQTLYTAMSQRTVYILAAPVFSWL